MSAPFAFVLGITSATARGGAALLRRDDVLGESIYEDEMQHAERLFAAIDEALQQAQLARSEIRALACDIGPGSFTGVRVGLASAKGIALALRVPLVGVCSLEAMAAAAFAKAPEHASLCAVLDAKRGERFLAVYDRALTALRGPAHVPAPDARAWVDDGIACCGRPARELSSHIIDDPSCDLPHPAWIARRGAALLAAGVTGDLGTLEPLYLRPPDAIPQAALKR